MRPQQQNRRMRGRNNNNNRGKGGPNPLTRSYESNGPDVKIRGNAQQIAEKYAALARDAMSSGDRVMAENYLQHAEHYNRIIAAAQAQMPIQNFQQNRDDFDDEDGDERDDFEVQGGNEQQPANGNGPQPVIEGVPAEVALNGENGGENQNRNRDGFRNRDRDGRDRDGRNRDRNRDFQNRNGNGDYQRRDFQRRDDRNEGPGDEQPRREEQPLPQEQPVVHEQATEVSPPQGVDQPADELPAFLTEQPPAPREAAPRRTRRPRRGEPRNEAPAEAAPADQGASPEAASNETLSPVEG